MNNASTISTSDSVINSEPTESAPNGNERANWGNDIEFLMSCIAMSVGLGNVWRFPFTALENGGGAFLIPYLIVLTIVGRPLYYMEMIIGQFSSRGSIKVYDMVPALRGKIDIQMSNKREFRLTECLVFSSALARVRRRLWSSDFDWNCCNVLCDNHGDYAALLLQFVQVNIAVVGVFT